MGIFALDIALLGAVLLLCIHFISHLQPLDAPVQLRWWMIAIGFALAEIFVVHVQLRKEALSISMSEVPLVLGLFLASPFELLLGQIIGCGLVLLFHRRQFSIMKLGYNLGLFALQACVALIVFHAVAATEDPTSWVGWVATFDATLAVDLVGGAMIFVAISIADGRPSESMNLLGVGLMATFINTCLALAAVLMISTNTSAAWLFAVLVVSLYMAYRANASLRKNHESLRVLYGFTRFVAEPRHAEAVIPAALEQLKRMFRAEIAQLILFPSTQEGPSLRTVSGTDGSVRQGEPLESSLVTGLWEDFARGRDAILVTREDDLNQARMLFPELGTDACMMTTLMGVQGVAGILMIGNPIAEVTPFGAGDLELLLTAVSHVGVSLENGRLAEDLKHNEHRALHDSLTGLPNRSLFHDRLRQAILSGERQGSAVAVMLLDLDNFKEVNDTLGHHNGDITLQEVGVRLRAVLRGSDTVARLGGDEFGILLPNVVDRAEIGRVAVQILEALQAPIFLEEQSLEVGVSIGGAVYPDQGLDAAVLIQRADIAMYSAKSHQTGYEVYTQERHRHSPGRLTLVSDLRAALDNGELVVHYQPKAELPSGKIIGVEALLRWDHPQHGLIPPDEFIPVAEHAGLMRAMTLFVLESAISQCRDWTFAGKPLTVAVNLSARSLLDARLPHDILILLGRWGVDASRLRLEITESSIMADPVRLVDVLAKLNDAGIGLSIDDFGTGYSSLAQLKKLPVDEIKIDKSFVLGMSHNENDVVIVQSTVDLGRNLGLRVVAEGVEDQETMDMLIALGCDVAQGFFLSRPIPADRFGEWIRELDEFSRNLESEWDGVMGSEEIVKVASAIPLRIA